MPISAPSFDPNARAKTAADVKYGAAEAQINRSIESARMQEAAQRAALDQYGAAGRQVIGDTYNQLYGNLEENRADTERQLGTQVQSVGQGYRDAASLADQARADSAQRLARLAGTIGLSNAGLADVSTGIEQLAARILGNSAQDDATRSGNLRTWAAQQDAFLRQGQAQAQREGAERKGSFEDELIQALAKLQADARNQEYGLQGSLLDLLNERGAFQTSAADQYVNELFGQQLQAAQYNLGEQDAISQAAARAAQLEMAQRELGLKERSYADSQKDDSLKNMLALAQNNREERMSGIDYLLKQQQLGKMPDASTIDEWAQQQGINPAEVDQLLRTYNSQILNTNKAKSILESDKVGGDLTKVPKEFRDLVNRYALMDPTALFTEEYPNQYQTGLSPSQIRTALAYIQQTQPQYRGQ